MQEVAEWLAQHESLHHTLTTQKMATQQFETQIHELEHLIDTLKQVQQWEHILKIFETIEHKKHDTMQVIEYLKQVKAENQWNEVIQSKVLLPLKKQLCKELEHFLENDLVEWPTLSLSNVNPKKTQQLEESFLSPFMSIFELEQEQSTPVELFSILIKPFVTRFQYHFYGKKKSNRLDRPEWFFQFVKKFIQDQYDYFFKFGNNLDYFLLQACVPLLEDKIQEVVNIFTTEALEQKNLWNHLLQQTISFLFFIKEKYHLTISSLLEPFYSNDILFTWWIQHDRQMGKDLIHKNEHLLRVLEAEDEMKPSSSCIPLLQYVTYLNEHYIQFISPNQYAWQYVDGVVLYLLRHYLHHTLQHNSDALLLISIINTCHYISHVIKEWTRIDYLIPFSNSIEDVCNEYSSHYNHQLQLLFKTKHWKQYASQLSKVVQQKE